MPNALVTMFRCALGSLRIRPDPEVPGQLTGSKIPLDRIFLERLIEHVLNAGREIGT